MIVVRPQEFTKVEFDVTRICTLAQRALEGVAALPDDLSVEIEVIEDQATNRVKVLGLDPVVFVVDGGALECYKTPRSLGDLESSITFTRLFLEIVDRQSATFGAPDLDVDVSLAHRMAWDINLHGRTARHGLHLHRPRYRYNFRNRHGFSDLADRTFDILWEADKITWHQLVELSDEARHTVAPGDSPPSS